LESQEEVKPRMTLNERNRLRETPFGFPHPKMRETRVLERENPCFPHP
jgi:hypothetical protein